MPSGEPPSQAVETVAPEACHTPPMKGDTAVKVTLTEPEIAGSYVVAERREDGLLEVRAVVWTETESQKGILIGTGGSMVRAVGTAARKQIEALLGRRVHLDLGVRVRRRWRRDEGLLDRLGIE